MRSVGGLDRKDRDLATLAVLALLSTGPRHPYDIARLLRETGKRFVSGLPRSLYHAVAKLEQAGLIEPSSTERQAGRPERTVYSLTDAGRDDARRRVGMLLATPTADADVTYAALSFIAVLARGQAVSAIRTRVEALSASIGQLEADLTSASEVPRLLLIESEFEITRMRDEQAWMTAIADQIESGQLTWLDAMPTDDSRQHHVPDVTNAGRTSPKANT